MNNSVAYIGLLVQKELNKMSKWFIPEVELTFISRLPGNNDSDLLITNDNLDELISLLERSKKRGDCIVE